MILTEALYREFRFGLCGAGGALENLVAADHVKQDMRLSPDSQRPESDYPWIIFRSVNDNEDNAVEFARERIEFEIIGLRSSATVGDDKLRQIRGLLKDHFKGKHVTIGKFEEDGTADPDGGLKVRAVYINSVEGYDEDLTEKSHIMMFAFTYLRS